MSASAHSGVGVKGRVEVWAHDVADLREAARDRRLEWDGLPKQGRAALAREVPPAHHEVTSNVTLQEYHEHLVAVADPGTAATPYRTNYLAVGTDATAEDHTQTGLLAEVDRVEVTSTDDRGEDLFTSTFLDTAEGNAASDLREVALASHATAGNGIEFNRALIAALTKNNSTTATIEVTLSYLP